MSIIASPSRLLGKSIPLISCVWLFFFGVISPVLIPSLASTPPYLVACGIYYWSVQRPDLLPLPLLALLGLLIDAILLLPFGLTAFCLMLMSALTQGQRMIFANQSHGMLWLGFALALLITQTLQWLLLSMLKQQWLIFAPVIMQTLLTVALFPPITWLLVQLHRWGGEE